MTIRVVFLCGSLEPGRDGVGDYTRRLAGELISQGYEAVVIALHDRHLKLEVVEDIQYDGLKEVAVLRLSSALSWNNRIKKALSFITQFDPNWISIQFVPFSFQNKGLPYSLLYVLNRLCAGRKMHIMFHELWVGVDLDSTKKVIFWGKLQRFLIRLMLYNLKVNIIHTQCGFYQYLLGMINYRAALLPLFGNIPNISTSYTLKDKKNSELVSFVIFGGIHDIELLKDFIHEAALYTNLTNVVLKFIFVGRNGELRDKLIDLLLSQKFVVDVLNEQPVEVISKILQESTFGITTTPMLLAEKSGSVAAMLEHGLQVICVRKELKIPYAYKPKSSNVKQYIKGNFLEIITNVHVTESPLNSIAAITHIFVDCLQQLILEEDAFSSQSISD